MFPQQCRAILRGAGAGGEEKQNMPCCCFVPFSSLMACEQKGASFAASASHLQHCNPIPGKGKDGIARNLATAPSSKEGVGGDPTETAAQSGRRGMKNSKGFRKSRGEAELDILEIWERSD